MLEYDLIMLLSKYGINFDNISEYKREMVLSKAKFDKVEYVLSFLRNELNISSKNIEKCPGILYCGVDNVKDNYFFLLKKGYKIKRINNCLHVLANDNEQLEAT